LLLYAYSTGVYSSRRIATHVREDVAFRVLAAGNVPDFRTLSEFRRRHLGALSGLFQQVVALAHQAKLITLKHVAVDGTKIQANASKHKAMSYDRLCRDETRIRAEVAEWFRRAAAIDAAEDAEYGPDRRGDEMPEELRRRESRLAWIRKAKAALEAEAQAKAERERAAQAANAAARADRPVNRRGPKPKPPREKPDSRMQYNFTDPESRIMKNADGAFIQAYNAQAAVDAAHHLIVATDVTARAADAPHLQPMATAIATNTGHRPRRLSADAGYFSEDAIQALGATAIDAYIATEKVKHGQRLAPAVRGRIPAGLSVKERMCRKLQTKAGRAVYEMRKAIAEPVFGQIKAARQFTRFLLRGHVKVRGEWALVATAHNICRLFVMRSRVQAVFRLAPG
ncbi:MAG TPA: transposase, partial [Xanthobacteraceae bacterium]